MKLKKDIRQRHLEAWEKSYLSDKALGKSSDAGAAVRAAIEAGWFDDPLPVGDVGDLLPSAVRKLAKQINDLYVEVTTIDPN